MKIKNSAFALLMFAVSNQLIYYASEAKQYSSDVLISLLGLMLFFYIVEEDLTNSRLALTSLLGGVLLWFSHPVVFVLTAIGFTTIYVAYTSRERGKLVQ